MTNVSYAREQIAMRNRIQTGLTPAEQRQINWRSTTHCHCQCHCPRMDR